MSYLPQLALVAGVMLLASFTLLLLINLLERWARRAEVA